MFDRISHLLVITITTIVILQYSITSACAEPTVANPKFAIEKIFTGHFEPSNMAFLGPNDILVLDRDEGKVFRIANGHQSEPLLDVKVSTNGYRGLLGIAVSNKEDTTTNVFLYFTESSIDDGDDTRDNPVNPLGNRLYKYDLVNNKLVNPRMLIDLPALPGPRHAGGIIAIGPDHNLYLTIGDLDGTFRYEKYETNAQNYHTGVLADGRSGILAMSQDGEPLSKGILGDSLPLKFYYAYGIRNSFGIDWDPLTSNLWDSENGPNFGDELNLVYPGFNSGWAAVQGFWKPDVEKMGPLSLEPNDLVDFDGKGRYSSPEFVWLQPAAPSAVKFLDSERYGIEYKNDLFVGDANNGNVYDFNLDQQRMGLHLPAKLRDKIANNVNELEDIIFAKGFGKVADIKIGPDGLLYVLSTQKHLTHIYRINVQ